MASDPGEAAFTAYYDIWNGDANKLGNGVTDAKVRAFLENGDPRVRRGPEGQVPDVAPPWILCEVLPVQDNGLGPGAGGQSSIGSELEIRLHVFTRRDLAAPAKLTELRNIQRGIAAKYHEQAIQSAAITTLGWQLGRPCPIRSLYGPSTSTFLHWIDITRITAKAG